MSFDCHKTIAHFLSFPQYPWMPAPVQDSDPGFAGMTLPRAGSNRHSGNLLAGIQKNSLDTGLRRYDELTVDSYLCGPYSAGIFRYSSVL